MNYGDRVLISDNGLQYEGIFVYDDLAEWLPILVRVEKGAASWADKPNGSLIRGFYSRGDLVDEEGCYSFFFRGQVTALTTYRTVPTTFLEGIEL